MLAGTVGWKCCHTITLEFPFTKFKFCKEADLNEQLAALRIVAVETSWNFQILCFPLWPLGLSSSVSKKKLLGTDAFDTKLWHQPCNLRSKHKLIQCSSTGFDLHQACFPNQAAWEKFGHVTVLDVLQLQVAKKHRSGCAWDVVVIRLWTSNVTDIKEPVLFIWLLLLWIIWE